MAVIAIPDASIQRRADLGRSCALLDRRRADMDGIVLGVALSIASAGTPLLRPPAETGHPTRTALALPAIPKPDTVADGWNDGVRTVHRTSVPGTRTEKNPARRFSTTERIIAVAAGFTIGCVVGGGIGGRITQSPNPDDDTSALKGIFIGAPIGAATGAILGWRLTR